MIIMIVKSLLKEIAMDHPHSNFGGVPNQGYQLLSQMVMRTLPVGKFFDSVADLCLKAFRFPAEHYL